jgi:hypothetical protein
LRSRTDEISATAAEPTMQMNNGDGLCHMTQRRWAPPAAARYLMTPADRVRKPADLARKARCTLAERRERGS